MCCHLFMETTTSNGQSWYVFHCFWKLCMHGKVKFQWSKDNHAMTNSLLMNVVFFSYDQTAFGIQLYIMHDHEIIFQKS